MKLILNLKRLENFTKLNKNFESGRPFPNVIIDNFLPKVYAEKVYSNFPVLKKKYIDKGQEFQKTKHLNRDVHLINPIIRQVLIELNSGIFLDFLEKLTGFKGLIVDPHYIGAGIHQLGNNGYLKVHRDFLINKKNNTLRVLNLLIYFNKNWKKSYGGSLGLYSNPKNNPKKIIDPIFNRAVIFQTNKNSWHGFPDPLNLPKNVYRKSLVTYYYENNMEIKKELYKTNWK